MSGTTFRKRFRGSLIIALIAGAAIVAWQAFGGEFGWGDALVILMLAILVGGGRAVRRFLLDRQGRTESAAAREARRSLPDGWKLHEPDRERFRLPGQEVVTYAIGASGPAGEALVVVGLGEEGAYRQLARNLRGELHENEGWVPPVTPPIPPPPEAPESRRFRVEPYAEAAFTEARNALPSGWVVYHSDAEQFWAGNRSVVVYAVSAAGPGGEAILALGVGQDGAFTQLARALRGEVEPSEGWAVPLPPVYTP